MARKSYLRHSEQTRKRSYAYDSNWDLFWGFIAVWLISAGAILLLLSLFSLSEGEGEDTPPLLMEDTQHAGSPS